jgi:hypothetical protein
MRPLFAMIATICGANIHFLIFPFFPEVEIQALPTPVGTAKIFVYAFYPQERLLACLEENP